PAPPAAPSPPPVPIPGAGASAPPPVPEVVPPIPPPPPPVAEHTAGEFLPMARDDMMREARGVRRSNVWFGMRGPIPPAEDPRTKLIDRGLVNQGLLTPEQLAEIHTVGDMMERARGRLDVARLQAAKSADAAVEAERAARAERKKRKQAEAAER